VFGGRESMVEARDADWSIESALLAVANYFKTGYFELL